MSATFHWISKDFTALSAAELYALIQLRVDVFMLEQSCLYRDLDNKDQKSLHFMAFDPQNQALVAYSRIVPPGLSFTEPAISRVITSLAYRGQGLGIELMERSIALCQEQYPAQAIRIGAQAHLQQFYSSFGFVGEGEIYDEDGIPHIEMVLQPE